MDFNFLLDGLCFRAVFSFSSYSSIFLDKGAETSVSNPNGNSFSIGLFSSVGFTVWPPFLAEGFSSLVLCFAKKLSIIFTFLLILIFYQTLSFLSFYYAISQYYLSIPMLVCSV